MIKVFFCVGLYVSLLVGAFIGEIFEKTIKFANKRFHFKMKKAIILYEIKKNIGNIIK